jgi:hypothetical protein
MPIPASPEMSDTDVSLMGFRCIQCLGPRMARNRSAEYRRMTRHGQELQASRSASRAVSAGQILRLNKRIKRMISRIRPKPPP